MNSYNPFIEVKTRKSVLQQIDTLSDNLEKEKDGTLIASKTQLGNVKIGDNINVDNDGTISVLSSGFAKFVGYYHEELYGDFSSAEEIKAFLEGCNGVIYVAPDDTECSNAHLVINWQVGSSGISLYYMDPLDLGSTGGLKSILIYWSSSE